MNFIEYIIYLAEQYQTDVIFKKRTYPVRDGYVYILGQRYKYG